MLEGLRKVINTAKRSASETIKLEPVQKGFIGMVEGWFYSNMIINCRKNFTENNLKEANVSGEEMEDAENLFQDLFDRCESTLSTESEISEVNREDYIEFKDELKKINSGYIKLIEHIEKFVNLKACEREIDIFKREIKNMGREIKTSEHKGKDHVDVSIDL